MIVRLTIKELFEVARGFEQSASTTSMGLFLRVSQVFGLALPYKKVSWARIA
jgi:hypothetical protein